MDAYEIVRRVGQGAMGVVYLARDVTLGRKAALKVIQPSLLGSRDTVDRFLLEARATAHFSHPHIVTVFGAGIVDGCPYVALEYLDGQSLRARLSQERVSARQALQLALPIAEALAEAHRHGVVHRDLKPENVLLPRDGRLRVVDFGLARILAADAEPRPESDPSLTTLNTALGPLVSRAGGLKGTPEYMAPEQWAEQEPTTAVDLWALGVILFEMLAGQRPFAGLFWEVAYRVHTERPPSLAELQPGIPQELADLVARCLAFDAAARPSAAQVVDELEQLLASRRRLVTLSAEECPYRGLLAFRREHAAFFFGRDAEVAACVERLRSQPVVPIVGPSGAGKTSFVLAGVIPTLEEQGAWTIYAMRPGSHPFRALLASLATGQTTRSDRPSGPGSEGASSPATAPTAGVALSADELLARPAELGVVLRRQAAEDGGRVLLYVDQLEELYVLTREPAVRAAFTEALALAADDPDSPVRVAFTIRDDFLGRLAEHAALAGALDRGAVLLRMPGPAALREIVTRPLEPLGYTLEDERLLDEMVRWAAAEPAALPLLQFALQRLWDARDRERRVLLRSAYEAMGGVEGALADHADGVLEAMPGPQVRLARLALLRLTTAEGTRARATRRGLAAEIGDEVGPVLDRLVDARLLVSRRVRDDERETDAGGNASLELAHESLLTRWGRLQRWREESREDRAALEQVRAAARTWAARGHPREHLWRGDSLAEAVRWRERFGGTVPPEVAEFLDASRSQAERLRRRRRSLTLAGVLGAVMVAVVAVVVALVVAGKGQQARRARDEARVKLAQALLSDAYAALGREDFPEARAKLRTALETADLPMARALWLRLQRLPQVFRGRASTAQYRLGFTPDGATLSSSGGEAAVRLWDITTGEPETLRGGRTSENRALALSPDGRSVAMGEWDGSVVLWDLPSRKKTSVLTGHTNTIMDLSFSADSALLASASEDRSIRVWDRAAAALLRAWPEQEAPCRGVDFAPGGRFFAAACGSAVQLWRADTGELLRPLDRPPGEQGRVELAPGGRVVAAAGADARVWLWDMATGQTTWVLSCPGAKGGEALAFSPDGKLVASGSWTGMLCVWRVADGAPVAAWLAHAGIVEDVRFSPDGAFLASAGFDSSVKVWRLSTVLGGSSAGASHDADVVGLAVSPDGRRLASGGWDRRVILWDLESGRGTLLGEHGAGVGAVAFSPDGKLLATGSDDKTIRVWDVRRGAVVRALAGHQHMIRFCAFTPDGARLVSTDLDYITVWDLATGNQLWSFRTGAKNAGIAVSPGGTILAVGGKAGVRLWETGTGKSLGVLQGPTEVYGVAMSPEGERVAASGKDGIVRLWDPRDGQERGTLVGHAGPVYGVAFGPDGKSLASSSADGSVRLWDLESRRTVRILRKRFASMNYVTLSPDGGTVFASSAGTDSVFAWDTATGKPRWRAPLLLEKPEALLVTHEGLVRLDAGGKVGAESLERLPQPLRDLVEAVDARALLADVGRDGRRVVFTTPDDTVELWDAGTGRRLAAAAVPLVDRAVVAGDGFVTLGGGRVELWRCTPSGCRSVVLAAAGATAIALERDTILVAAGPEVRFFSLTGTLRRTIQVSIGMTALLTIRDRLVVGFSDGSVEVRSTAGAGPRAPLRLKDTPARPVTALVEGPLGTLAAGYANGALGVWSLADGRQLDQGKLHGTVVHLVIRGGKLLAATDAGDHLTWDLSELQRPYCDLLAEVWAQVPVVWEGERPVRRPPPEQHPCARRVR